MGSVIKGKNKDALTKSFDANSAKINLKQAYSKPTSPRKSLEINSFNIQRQNRLIDSQFQQNNFSQQAMQIQNQTNSFTRRALVQKNLNNNDKLNQQLGNNLRPYTSEQNRQKVDSQYLSINNQIDQTTNQNSTTSPLQLQSKLKGNQITGERKHVIYKQNINKLQPSYQDVLTDLNQQIQFLHKQDQKQNEGVKNIQLAASPPSIQNQQQLIGNQQVQSILKQLNISKENSGSKFKKQKFSLQEQQQEQLANQNNQYNTYDLQSKDKMHGVDENITNKANQRVRINNEDQTIRLNVQSNQDQYIEKQNHTHINKGKQLHKSYDYRSQRYEQPIIVNDQVEEFITQNNFENQNKPTIVMKQNQIKRVDLDYQQTQQNKGNLSIRYPGFQKAKRKILQTNQNSPKNSNILEEQLKNIKFQSKPSSPKKENEESKQHSKTTQQRPFSGNNRKLYQALKDNLVGNEKQTTNTDLLQSPDKKKEKQRLSSANQSQDKIKRFNSITKFAFATTVGYVPGNPNKQNQDSFILFPNMGQIEALHFFGVCDGHGLFGHLVSQYIRDNLPNVLLEEIKRDNFNQSSLSKYKDDQQKMNRFLGSDRFKSNSKNYFKSSFNLMHSQLASQQGFDTVLSGSTCCTILFDQKTIYVGNCGDSRAMMCSYSPKKGIKITQLSNDHKPSCQMEKQRIRAAGGRIECYKNSSGDNLGPERVWLMQEDSPGLAMSRSIGDCQAHSIGVTSDPETLQYELTPEDKFIVIASDGIWEFLENEKVAEIIWPFFVKHSPEAAGNALVRAAALKWKENDTIIDDITCIIIFLEIE